MCIQERCIHVYNIHIFPGKDLLVSCVIQRLHITCPVYVLYTRLCTVKIIVCYYIHSMLRIHVVVSHEMVNAIHGINHMSSITQILRHACIACTPFPEALYAGLNA